MAYTMEYPTKDLFYNLLVQTPLDDVCKNKLGNIPFSKNVMDAVYPVSLVSSFKQNYVKAECVGIDIPVLMQTAPDNSNGKTIVIVGQSPLRTPKCKSSPGGALVGCPFGVSQQMGIPSQCDVYKLIFQKLMNKGFTLYITDAVKVWFTSKNKLKPSNNDEMIFLKEIARISSLYKIDAIISWGKTAEYFVKSLPIGKNHQPNIIHLMHPGILNWDRWKLSLFEEAVYNNNPQLASQYYPNNNTSSSADIVSDLVVRKI